MKHTRALIQRLQALDVPVDQRNEYLCTAIATAMATQLPLPGAKVKSIVGYYNDHHHRTVTEFVNAVNEDIVYDAKEAIALVRNTYALRYAFAFDGELFDVAQCLTTLMGCDKHVTPVKYQKLLSDKDTARVANKVQDVVSMVFGHCLHEQREHEDPLHEAREREDDEHDAQPADA